MRKASSTTTNSKGSFRQMIDLDINHYQDGNDTVFTLSQGMLLRYNENEELQKFGNSPMHYSYEKNDDIITVGMLPTTKIEDLISFSSIPRLVDYKVESINETRIVYKNKNRNIKNIYFSQYHGQGVMEKRYLGKERIDFTRHDDSIKVINSHSPLIFKNQTIVNLKGDPRIAFIASDDTHLHVFEIIMYDPKNNMKPVYRKYLYNLDALLLEHVFDKIVPAIDLIYTK